MQNPITLTEKILERPDAVLQVRAMQAALAAEQQRRQDFYEWVTEDVKAEFINGQIIVHSPVRREHWKVLNLLSRVLSVYASIKQLGTVGTEKVMIALTRNDYEPDLVFFSNEKAAQFTEDQVLFPAPDLAVEILSKKTASIDRNIKKTDYAAHGVREYWIVDPSKKQVEQYLLSHDDTVYFPAKHHLLNDTLASVAVAGFAIPVQAIFDEAANLETLRQLLDPSAEEQA